MTQEILQNIKWLGHDGFAIATGDVTVVIDPFQVDSGDGADIILITHSHYDHCSVEDISKFVKSSTVIITEPESAEKISEAGIPVDVKTVVPGDCLDVCGTRIEVVPAYNIDKEFHLKEKNWLGFIVTIADTRIYHSGDTDRIPEMAHFDVDIALLPVSGTYVMKAEEAVQAAEQLKPAVAIPMHYDAIVGTAEDAALFKKKLENVCEVFIPQRS